MPLGQNLSTTFPLTINWEATEANGKCPLQATKKQGLRLAPWLTYQVSQGTHQLLFHEMWENTDSLKNCHVEYPWKALNELKKRGILKSQGQTLLSYNSKLCG